MWYWWKCLNTELGGLSVFKTQLQKKNFFLKKQKKPPTYLHILLMYPDYFGIEKQFSTFKEMYSKNDTGMA